MARTEVRSEQIKNGTVRKEDIDITTSGQSVVTNIIAGTNITISGTGADIGTGAVTINASGSTGVSTLNTLTSSTQTFATGTTGTDFNISSATSTHTFNIPDASASNRGLITTGAQTISGIKTITSNFLPNANDTLTIGSSSVGFNTVFSKQLLFSGAAQVIGTESSHALFLRSATFNRIEVLASGGHFVPVTDAAITLGTASRRFDDLFAVRVRNAQLSSSGNLTLSLDNSTDQFFFRTNNIIRWNVGGTDFSITPNVADTYNVGSTTRQVNRFYGNLYKTGNDLLIVNETTNQIRLGINNNVVWNVSTSGHIVPELDNTRDIGTSALSVKDIYTKRLRCNGNDLLIGTDSAHQLSFVLNNNTVWEISSTGTYRPSVSNTYDFGSTSNRVQRSYINQQFCNFTSTNRGSGDGQATAGYYLQIDGGDLGFVRMDSSATRLEISGSNSVRMTTSGTARWDVTSSGTLQPVATTSYNLGGGGNVINVSYIRTQLCELTNCGRGSGAGQATAGCYFAIDGTDQGFVRMDSSNTRLDLSGSNSVRISTNGLAKWDVISSGTMRPVADNAYDFGGSGNRAAVIYAANGTINTSDEREKNTITPSILGLSFINLLEPVSYKFNVGRNLVSIDENGDEVVTPVTGARTHYGLIAQQVKETLDTLNIPDFGGWILTDTNDVESPQGLRYDQFIAPLIKAIQELNARLLVLENN